MSKTRNVLALILKRQNSGEADRVVTMYTSTDGKLVGMAKGIRKITSKKKSSLEPGNLVKIFLTDTPGMPIILQTELIEEFAELKQSLSGVRRLLQILEVVDAVGVEAGEHVFEAFIRLLQDLNENPRMNTNEVVQQLDNILQVLGYQNLQETQFTTIQEYVEFLANRKMHAWSYLHLQS